jgi:hypothetical protein
LNSKEQAQLFILVGFAAARGCDINIQVVLHFLMEKRKKTQSEKETLQMIIAFVKDNGIQELPLSKSDIQMLESAVKFEI